jgi:riboflavin synthase
VTVEFLADAGAGTAPRADMVAKAVTSIRRSSRDGIRRRRFIFPGNRKFDVGAVRIISRLRREHVVALAGIECPQRRAEGFWPLQGE